MENVIDGLQGFNGGNWKFDLQECGDGHSQHVGFIYNAAKVELSDVKDMWQFNGASSDSNNPCKGRLRPGRHAYVKSKSGGFDFHLIVVHTDSGRKASDLENRNRVLDRFDTTSATLNASDKDVVAVGDFNTMGTGSRSAEEELQEFSAKVDSEAPGFKDIPVEPRSTEYYGGDGGWLDHIVVTKGTQELAQQTAAVHGYCSIANYEKLSDMPSAYNKLSDHCPVVIDFLDQDLD